MSDQKIQQKVKELELIMFQYKQELGVLDKELFQAISDASDKSFLYIVMPMNR